MFGQKQRIRELELEVMVANTAAQKALRKHLELLKEWNALVTRINKLGGEAALTRHEQPRSQLDKDELRKLIQLCHPDKHGNSKLAIEMTARLNQLRG